MKNNLTDQEMYFVIAAREVEIDELKTELNRRKQEFYRSDEYYSLTDKAADISRQIRSKGMKIVITGRGVTFYPKNGEKCSVAFAGKTNV